MLRIARTRSSHELHFDSYVTCSLALFTSSSLSIEGEDMVGVNPICFAQRLVGKEGTDGIVCLQIGGRVAPGTFTDRVLIYKLHMLDGIHIAF